MNPVHVVPAYFIKIHFNIISYLMLGIPSDLFLSDFPAKLLYEFFVSPMRTT